MISAIPAIASAGSLLSDSVKQLSSSFQGLLGVGAAEGTAEQGAEELAHRYEQSLQKLHQLVRQSLKEAGIQLQSPVELRLNGLGRVVADAFHPQRDAIEKVFNENPLLTEKFEEAARHRRDLAANQGLGQQFRVTIADEQIRGELL